MSKATHSTFEAYCRERFGFSRIRAHQNIEAAAVHGNLLTLVNTVPTTESQCRPLTVRKAGALLSGMTKAKNQHGAGDTMSPAKLEDLGISKKRGDTMSPQLSDLGISRKQSSRWQAEAEVQR